MSKFPTKFGPDTEVTEVDLDQQEIYSGGERLTEERAEELAAAVRNRSANLIPGGKLLSRDGSHSPTIQYRVPAALREAAEQLAVAEGVSVSRLARRALEEYVHRHAS